MNQIMVGEYLEKVVENGIYIPKKFQLNHKKVRMLLLKEQEWVSVQLFDNLENIQELISLHEDEHVEVVLNDVVEIPENGFFSLPELFLQKVGDDTEVIVCGVMNHLEIITIAEMEALEKSMKDFEEQLDDLWDF